MKNWQKYTSLTMLAMSSCLMAACSPPSEATHSALEATDSDPRELALQTALNYGNSVHCNGVPFHEDDPLKSVYNLGDAFDGEGDDGERASYAVLQFVDLHCYGGSGTGAFLLTRVDWAMGNRYVVAEEGDNNLLEKSEIYKVKDISYDEQKRQFTIIDYTYDVNDSNCCPSIKRESVIDVHGNLIARKNIGKVEN